TAGLLQRRPQPRVVRQVWMRSQVRVGLARPEQALGLLRCERPFCCADQVYTPFEVVPINLNFDLVAIAEPADWPTCQRLWPDVADTRARRDSRKAPIGQHRDGF